MKPNIDLGKYDLTKMLRNPITIHLIQDKLIALKGDSIFAEAIRGWAKDNVRDCVKMIVDQYRDNPKMIREIVGNEMLDLIQEFEGISLANDIPSNLFSKPNIGPKNDYL